MLNFVIELATWFAVAFAIGTIFNLSFNVLYDKLIEIANKARNIGYIIACAKIKKVLSKGKYKKVNVGLLDEYNNEIYSDTITAQNIDRRIKSGMIIRI